MPPVLKVTDQLELVDTNKYPYAKFPFQKFNPIQSRVFDYFDKDNNLIIAAATAAGKTVVAELCLSYEIRKRGGKGLYLVPMKALAQEKIDDWTAKDHHFSDLNISICTGDYRLTEDRKLELEKADLIIMTTEMLTSRCRNMKSEKSEFLQEIGTLISDEFHLLTVPGRGSHAEVGLMKFTEINKKCRIVALSATMPNVNEIADWVSYVLTKKNTVLLKSNYRPCPLNFHYEKYEDAFKYEDKELNKVSTALGIVQYYDDDKFLIFAHTKRTGELMKKALLRSGIHCEFHNADLDKEKRIKIENDFKKDAKLRVLIATSTLAWGINTSARRVIVLGVHRGLDEVATYDIMQMAGRSGRPAYDPVGDAYLLLPDKKFDDYKEKIRKPQKIESQMLDDKYGQYRVLAFHLVSEIHQEKVSDREDIQYWYNRTLASFQENELPEEVVDKTLDSLKKCGAIWEENGRYTVTSVGKIASMFYFSPFDVSDLKNNFNLLFDEHKEDDDYWLSMALGNLDTHRFGIVSRAEREEMGGYSPKAFSTGYPYKNEAGIKAGYAYHLMLNGRDGIYFGAMCRNLRFDFPRLNQVLYSLDSYNKWGRAKWFNELQLRVTYGVKGPMVYLCRLPGIGKVRAEKLWNAGIRKVEDIADNPSILKSKLGFKQDKIQEILNEARKIILLSSLD